MGSPLDDIREPVSGDIGIIGASFIKSTKTTAYTPGMLITQGVAGSSVPMLLAIARRNDLTAMLRRARLKVNDATWLNAVVRVHFFKDLPVFTNGDAGNFAAGLTEASYLGACDVTLDQSFSDPFVKGLGAPNAGSEINFEPSAGTQNVYAVLEARSTTAGGHTASTVFSLVTESLRN